MMLSTCWPSRVFALWGGAAALCCALAGGAIAQDGVSERIAAQRDRAAEQNAEQTAEGEAAAAAVTGPVPGDAPGELDAIRDRPNPEDLLPLGPAAPDGSPAGDAPSAGGGWVMNTLAAMGVVIGLIFLMRWLAKRGGVGGGVRVSSSPIVEVLSRTAVAPKNHVVLLRVGARILVVNDGHAGMRTLATVDDPDEVAGLLQSVQAAQETSMSNTFGKAMAKLSGPWSASEDTAEMGNDEGEHGMDRARTTLAGLRSRLRLAAEPGRGGGT